jgi:putative transcriptional regulator
LNFRYLNPVREFGPTSLNLAGSLLIAHPGLLDPNFRRAVLFISTHETEEGAFGLILNRPTGQTVAGLLPGREDLLEVAAVPVLQGGPVGSDQLVFASFLWDTQAKRMECRHHLSLDDARESVREHKAIIRAFVGYSGWGKGQLEAELAQHAWLVKPPEAGLFQADKAPHLWRDLLSGFGPAFRLTAEAPEDPSLN